MPIKGMVFEVWAHKRHHDGIYRVFTNFTVVLCVNTMLNKNTWGVKKCGANQKQHCKQGGVTKRFDIS